MKISRAELNIKVLNERAEDAQNTLTAFAEQMQNDAAYALAWGEKAFQAAAIQKVCKATLNTIQHIVEGEGCDLETAQEMCKAGMNREVLRSAAHVSCSSSHCTNLIDQYILAAKVGIIELLDR
jgi:hypothetical protein